jgi:hypothetical protein
VPPRSEHAERGISQAGRRCGSMYCLTMDSGAEDEQVHVVGLAVELAQFSLEVAADLAHHLR